MEKNLFLSFDTYDLQTKNIENNTIYKIHSCQIIIPFVIFIYKGKIIGILSLYKYIFRRTRDTLHDVSKTFSGFL